MLGTQSRNWDGFKSFQKFFCGFEVSPSKALTSEISFNTFKNSSIVLKEMILWKCSRALGFNRSLGNKRAQSSEHPINEYHSAWLILLVLYQQNSRNLKPIPHKGFIHNLFFRTKFTKPQKSKSAPMLITDMSRSENSIPWLRHSFRSLGSPLEFCHGLQWASSDHKADKMG